MFLCFPHQLCPKPKPKEFLFVVPKNHGLLCLPVSSSSFPLSVIPNEGGVSSHFLSLTTSRSSLGCSSSETGTELYASTRVPIANLRGFNRTTGKSKQTQGRRGERWGLKSFGTPSSARVPGDAPPETALFVMFIQHPS